MRGSHAAAPPDGPVEPPNRRPAGLGPTSARKRSRLNAVDLITLNVARRGLVPPCDLHAAAVVDHHVWSNSADPTKGPRSLASSWRLAHSVHASQSCGAGTD